MLRLQRRKPDASVQPLSEQERRFALGTRTLADLLAPAAVEIARNHLRLVSMAMRMYTQMAG
jgi:hypothetical protein